MPLSHVSYFKGDGLLQLTVDPSKATKHTANPPPKPLSTPVILHPEYILEVVLNRLAEGCGQNGLLWNKKSRHLFPNKK
jgi:hypothetical protein